MLERNGDPNQCCSGYAEDINVNGEIQRTCKLRDFTDISHLLNRYVSSLWPKFGIEDGVFDLVTGNIDPTRMSKDSLIRFICEADICGSRAIADGVAYNQYRVPGIENSPDNNVANDSR